MGIFNRFLHPLTKQKTETECKETQNRLLAQINRYASLIRLQDERQLIEVITSDHIDSFQSMIVGVDLYNQQLIIDEFSPRIQNPQSLIGQTITLRHQYRQQMIRINSEIIGWDETSRCLNLKLPENVDYQPRRHDLRINLTGQIPLTAHIDPLYGSPWHASVTNISLGGLRMLVTGDLRNNLHKHKPLKKCEIKLSNGKRISCQGRVKSFSFNGRPFRRTEISIAFEAMSDNDLAELEHFVDQLSMTV